MTICPSPLTAADCPHTSLAPGAGLTLELEVCADEALLTLHGAGPGTNYYFLSRTPTPGSPWQLETQSPGLVGQDSIVVRVPLLQRSNLIFTAGVGMDSDGDGLEDVYEALITGTDPAQGDSGTEGLPDGYKDPDRDGWTHVDELRNLTDPFLWNAPPPPANVRVKLEEDMRTATLHWEPDPEGAVVEYVIYRSAFGSSQEIARLNPATTTFSDPRPYDYLGYEFSQEPYYRMQAVYDQGTSLLSDPVSAADPRYSVNGAVVRGQDGQFFAAFSAVPEEVETIRLSSLNRYFDPVHVDIPAAEVTNGCYLLDPLFVAEKVLQILVIPCLAEGGIGTATPMSHQAHGGPVLDGSEHLRDNVRFLLRAAGGAAPFAYHSDVTYGTLPRMSRPYLSQDYDYAGYTKYDEAYGVCRMDPRLPWYENALWRNFVLHDADYDPLFGYLDHLGREDDVNRLMRALQLPKYMLDPAQPVFGPSLLGLPDSRWIYLGRSDSTLLPEMGIFLDTDGTMRMLPDTKNHFGLPVNSIKYLSQAGVPPSQFPSLHPGTAAFVPTPNSFFPDVSEPVLETIDFYFAPAEGIMPGHPLFDVEDPSPMIVASCGRPLTVVGWAKQRVVNGDPGKFVYVQQYFERAVKVAKDGSLTEEETGMVSEYGEFFPTEAGRVALLTQPDPTQGGLTGACLIHVLRLSLDVNHDGIMDETFAGPDNTSWLRPYVFWANNDIDRGNRVNGDDWEEDDLHESDPDATENDQLPALPDHAYRAPDNFLPSIPSMRDLEDYARVHISGIDGLLVDLPESATVELTWRFDSDPNPSLRLFRAVETDGGTKYLTEEPTAMDQLAQELYVGDITAGHSLLLKKANEQTLHPYYIFCGKSRGTGELTVQVKNGFDVVGSASMEISIRDIKELYDRWTVGDVPFGPIFTEARRVTKDLPRGITQTMPQSQPSKDYILWVHGWNLEPWLKDRFAETTFKRMYWQGYQGDFGSFRWPTTFGFGEKNPGIEHYTELIFKNRHFDYSEFAAWESGSVLVKQLKLIERKYSKRLYLYAHSLGAVVAGEALRLANTNHLVECYVVSQGALSAHSYEQNIEDPEYFINFNMMIFGELEMNFGPHTPNIYINALTNLDAGTSRRVNFFNPNDYTLAENVWQLNQITKPDSTVSKNYIFDGFPYDGHANYSQVSRDDDYPWKRFGYYKRGVFEEFIELTMPNDRFEIMSFIAESRAKPIGVMALQTEFNNNVDLTRGGAQRIWPEPSNDELDDYSAHKWHSAQFRSNLARQHRYYKVLLGIEGMRLIQ